MLNLAQIRSIQVEISNHCNSACPQCPRNYYGGDTIPTLPLRKWSLSEFKTIINDEVLSQVEKVYFCGTYGDPMTNKHLVDMCQWVKRHPKVKVGIHTNGGIGNEQQYRDLAAVVDFLAFGIDGLEDTNHVYRRNVKWRKVMRNVEVFIQAGGRAIWDFVVFQHNQHQVESAQKLSQSMGFARFNVKKTSRFLRRNHEYHADLDVCDKRGRIEYKISVPTDQRFVNPDYKKILALSSVSEYAQTTHIDCNSRRIGEIYIGADGFVFPCGWLHDRLYGPDIALHPDHAKLHRFIEDAGGYTKTNVFYSPLIDILEGPWFDVIERSWQGTNRLERCAMICGTDANLIGQQNNDVRY